MAIFNSYVKFCHLVQGWIHDIPGDPSWGPVSGEFKDRLPALLNPMVG
jgi:hypothetical protein